MINIIAVDDDVAFLSELSTKIFTPNNPDFKLSLAVSKMYDQYNVEYLLAKIGEIKPDIVLLDFSFVLVGQSDDYGIYLLRVILDKFPSQKIIMLVGDDDDNNAVRSDKITRAIQEGAAAYLGKREIINHKEAIFEVVNGEKYISKETMRIMLQGFKKEHEDARQKFKLSLRHVEILFHLSNDLDLTEVADKMMNRSGDTMSYDGIVFHIRTIRHKFCGKDINGQLEPLKNGTLHGLIAKAMREKIIY